MKHYICAIVAAAVLSACGSTTNTNTQPASKIDDSFGIEPGTTLSQESDFTVDQALISISKSALGKEFLLQGSWVDQAIIPSFENMKSRLVTFDLRDDQLIMKESSRGNSITSEMPQSLLLASFPVISEFNDRVVFDFNKGMNNLFVAYDWYASDAYGSGYFPNFYAMDVKLSYIESAEFQSQNRLYIRQVVQPGGIFKAGIEVRYYLSPYQTNANFEPKKTPGFRQFGFFEANPILTEDGTTVIHTSRFDDSKPITFAVSSNTPEEYKDAVKDAILYWNKAFGREVVKAVDAPEGVTAPNPDYNIVQWVTWDQAGFAYADAQLDPLTGEILHAQVYLTSVFAFMGKQRAKQLLTKLEETGGLTSRTEEFAHPRTKENQPVRRFALQNFFGSHRCERELSGRVAGSLRALVARSASDAEILEVSKDYVREVVAHEIGHTLGLRHNFAGSISAEYDAAGRREAVKHYFETGKALDNKAPASTVMDYQVFEDAAITGELIENSKLALSYDRMAIQNLYAGKEYDRKETPLFCTDTEMYLFECVPFDIGQNPYVYYPWVVNEQLKGEALRLVNNFVAAKAPYKGLAPKNLDEVSLFGAQRAYEILYDQWFLIYSLSNGSSSKAVRNGYPLSNPLFAEEIADAETAHMEAQIGELGRLSNLFPSVEVSGLSEEFEKLIRSDKYRKGVGFGGQAYEFSDSEIELMLSLVSRYEEALTEAMVIEDSMSFGMLLGESPSEKISEAMKPFYEARMRGYLMELADREPIKTKALLKVDLGIPEEIEVSLPVYRLDSDARLAVASDVSGIEYGGWYVKEPVSWGAEVKESLKKELFDQMTAALGGKSVQDIDLESLPKEAEAWVRDNVQILNNLGMWIYLD